MIQKPKLKSFLTLFPIDKVTWGIQGGADELSRITLREPRAIQTFSALLPHLTGDETAETILTRLESEGIDRPAAQQLLEGLEGAKLIEEAEQEGIPPEAGRRHADQVAFFSRYGNGSDYQSALAGAHVAVVGDNRLGRALVDRLDDAGIGRTTALSEAVDATRARLEARHNGSASGVVEALALDRSAIWTAATEEDVPDLVIIAQDRHDPALLESLDTFSKRHTKPWMMVRALNPLEGWVGPLFVPDETACYLSLDARLKGNMSYFEEYQAFERYLKDRDQASSPCGGLHATFDLMASIAVVEAVKFISGFTIPILAGRFLTVDFESWDTEVHHVLRMPRLGLESPSTPLPFPWKEVPYGDTKTPRA